MKYAVFFLLVCVALAAAAPQYITTFPGYYGTGLVPTATGTLVAGPTVVNTPYAYGGRFVNPGYVGTYF